MTPEVLHIAFTMVGVTLGWYIKHQSIGIPQEVLDAVKKLLNMKQARDGHGLLKDLLAGLEQAERESVASPAPPPASLPRS